MKLSNLFFLILISTYGFNQNLIKNSNFLPNNGSIENWTSGNANQLSFSQIDQNNVPGIIVNYDDETIDIIASLKNLELIGKSAFGKYSEYLQGELSEALIAGNQYKFSCKIKLSENSARAIKGLGITFSSTASADKYKTILKLSPQVKFEEFIDNKDQWKEISAEFTATGSEKYFLVGIFESNFETKKITQNISDTRIAKYYINTPSITILEKKEEPTSSNIEIVNKTESSEPDLENVPTNNNPSNTPTATLSSYGNTTNTSPSTIGNVKKAPTKANKTKSKTTNTNYKKVGKYDQFSSVDNFQGLFFTVQIGTYSNPLNTVDISTQEKILMKNTNDGKIRYSCGIFHSVKEAQELKTIITEKGMTDAFITAYYKGERILINDAEKLLVENGAIILQMK